MHSWIATTFLLFAFTSATSCLGQMIVAHRGASHDAPENTLAAFRLAWERGADGIEGDFYLTADGQIVCIHDKTTKRVAPDQPELTVAKATLKQLRQLDVGRWKDAEFTGERIPTLEEVLAIVPSKKRIFVEIKCGPEIVPKLKSQLAASELANDQIVIIAFDRTVVQACRQSMPQYKCNWLTGYKQEDGRAEWKPGVQDVVDSLQQTKATGLGTQGNENVIDRSFVNRVRKAGCEFHVWTINDAASAKRFVALGVDSITTDRPAFIRRELPSTRVSDEETSSRPTLRSAVCQGTYQHHLQGIGADDDAIYWSFTTTLAKTDRNGALLNKIPVANHHGDLCHHDGRLYVAVNLGRFNDPQGNADSWVYVYDADSLKEIARHKTPEVVYGAGGIGFRRGHFFVVGGLPDAVDENYVYEYDADFAFLKKHVIRSGHTHLGIQTATYGDSRWWFGCYGAPKILLVTDDAFQMEGRYEFDCSLGIAGISDGRLLTASGRCHKDQGCTGRAQVAVPDRRAGLSLVPIESPVSRK